MNSMPISRRYLLLGGLAGGAAAMLSGCQSGQGRVSALPGPWQRLDLRPDTHGNGYTPLGGSTGSAGRSNPVLPGVHSRTEWTSAPPILSRINPLGAVSRITIHHEGMPGMPVTFTDLASTRARLEMIRNSHVNQRGWADIGYHFIVDRAGRVWEGRPLAYQGAHVKNENEHNIGVMCLGNFEIQQPSAAQVTALERFVRDLRRRFQVAEMRIYTHRELGRTTCPGRYLQPRVDTMRRAHRFA